MPEKQPQQSVCIADLRSKIMRSVRTKHTKPELEVRKAIRRLGLGFKLHGKKLPGSPDIVLPAVKTVIFVHGCFWHRHKNCKYASVPKTNQKFWQEKFDKNIERDSKNSKALKKLGWKVIIIWGGQTHDIAKIVSRLKRNIPWM